MAWLDAKADFNPDLCGLPFVGIAAQLQDYRSEDHAHEMGQVLFSPNRMMSITTCEQVHVIQLAPKYMLWIPPKQIHQVRIQNTAQYRSIYLDIEHYQHLPTNMGVQEMSPLLHESFEHLARCDFDINWEQGIHAHALAICLHELSIFKPKVQTLLLPQDRRLQALHEMDTIPPLNELVSVCGACEKTITRIFRTQTGMTYQQWRQQWRLAKAHGLLLEQKKQIDIADTLGFASLSAFITFFKKAVGCTPNTYLKKMQEGNSLFCTQRTTRDKF